MAVITLAWLTVASLPAQTTTWTGAESTDWLDPDNWSDGVPDSDTDVVFDQTTTNLPLVRGTANSLTFQSTLTAPFTTTLSGTTINLDTGGLLVENGAPSITFTNSSNRGINVRRAGSITPFVNQSPGTLVSMRFMAAFDNGVGFAEFNGVGDFEIWQRTGGTGLGWIFHEDFTGTLFATGTDVYLHEAPTIINGGTLVLDAPLRSPRFDDPRVTVNGGTLTGNGRVGTPHTNQIGTVDVAINNGGVVDPGRVGETGALTFENWDVNFNDGATLRLDLVNPTDHDQLLFAKTGEHVNNVIPTLNLATSGTGVILDLNLLPGFDANINDQFTILDGYLAVNGHFAGLTDGTVFEVDGWQFQINYGGSETILTVIPEPSAALLILAGIGLCLLRGRFPLG